MSRNTLTEGIREVFRDPALLLIEIGWRWTFGVIAVLLFESGGLYTNRGVGSISESFLDNFLSRQRDRNLRRTWQA